MAQYSINQPLFRAVHACDKENKGGCMHTCVKIGEGLRCECNDGFILAKDGKRCNKGMYG